MLIPVFSDLHAHNYEQFSTRLESGRNSRLQDCLNVVSQVADYACEHNCPLTFFLGDAVHSRTNLNVDVITSTVESFRSLSTTSHLIMLVGNHDQYTRVGGIHSTSLFSDSKIKVIDSPVTFSYDFKVPVTFSYDFKAPVTFSYDFKVKVACAPFMSDVEALKSWLHLDATSADILFLHQGISEATVGPFDMHVKTELSIKDIPFDKFKLVVAGDFHKRQFLADGKFHYVGSPLQLSFSERDEKKGFSVINTDDWSVTFVETTAPKFFLYEDCNSLYHDIEKCVCNPSRDFIRIVSVDPLFDPNEVKVKYPRIQVVHSSLQTPERKRSDTSRLDDSQLLEKYIGECSPWQDQVELYNLGRELLLGISDDS